MASATTASCSCCKSSNLNACSLALPQRMLSSPTVRGSEPSPSPSLGKSPAPCSSDRNNTPPAPLASDRNQPPALRASARNSPPPLSSWTKFSPLAAPSPHRSEFCAPRTDIPPRLGPKFPPPPSPCSQTQPPPPAPQSEIRAPPLGPRRLRLLPWVMRRTTPRASAGPIRESAPHPDRGSASRGCRRRMRVRGECGAPCVLRGWGIGDMMLIYREHRRHPELRC